MRKSFITQSGQVGIQIESRTNLYEIILTLKDEVKFFHNSQQVVGLPIEGPHKTFVVTLFQAFEKNRNDLEAYLVHPTNEMWWKLKETIEA